MVFQSILVSFVTVAASAFLAVASASGPPKTGGISKTYHWVDTWTSMPQLTEPANLPAPPFNQTNLVFPNSTIRQTIQFSVGADTFRVRFSNVFGGSILDITAATVSLPLNDSPGASAIQPKTLKTLTFSGSSSFSVPNGALVVSDPVQLSVKAQSILTITMYLANGQTTNLITSHPGSRTTTWMTFGNQVNAANIDDASTQSVAHWYYISAVEAWAPRNTFAFALVGDSITDGRGSDTDKNNRWPNLLFARLQASKSTQNIAVINQAAGGNRILADGLGPNALGRIDRDVLSHSGVRAALIFEGVNDMAGGSSAPTTAAEQQDIGDRLITAYKQMVTRIQALGIPVFGATITPFCNPVTPDLVREVTRQRINDFIRNGGLFDGVVDFDAAIRDPTAPIHMAEQFNSGDFLHPNVNGYQTMANAFPVKLLADL